MSERIVWVVNHYATNHERDGRSGRHEQFARRLTDHGWRAVLIAASTDHPSGRQGFGPGRLRRRWRGPTHDFVWLRGVSYARFRAARVLDVLLFTALVLLPGSLRDLPRPDLVVGSSVHPPAAWAGSVLARRLGVPFVYEPRDLWPETLVQFGAIGRRSPVTRVLALLERLCTIRAAHVVSPLEGAGRYLAGRGLHAPFTWVPNGVSPELDHDGDGDTRDMAAGADPTTAVARARSSLSTDAPFEITYLGSMGPANALGPVVDAFDRAASRPGGEHLVLRLVGAGPERPVLERRAAAGRHVDRVVFEGQVSQRRARAIGRRADCLVANLLPLDLYRHGTSLNKFFEYLLLAKPVVLGASVPNDPVTDSGAGLRVDGGDVDGLADAFTAVAAMTPAERAERGARGRAHVLAHYDFDLLTARLADAFDAATDAAMVRDGPTPTVLGARS
ncbi:glycosyltransferase family 4 protein [Frigoribacterium sp. VKM Ac-1396]|uniref:glycosyltransferase family 4 protein n=1 Tax=Frigoribacterium sp. VKM Ac-1396 TaxID=2783821 RepID=UPI00188B92E2|nr:glycosyltransferase family 4 protein [Frigoribacterium sp. VKM Ac-1396]MBF4601636.1 glycosyltransferase family 4 protein [Frigoribacterium sp. VKM Ac-1396]